MRWPAVTAEGGDCTFYVTADDANPGVFHLHGELDVDCAGVLDELPVALRLDQPVVLDLTEVTFCDSVGLTGLLKVRRPGREQPGAPGAPSPELNDRADA
jgi:anti-anti-sigma regulatory factor